MHTVIARTGVVLPASAVVVFDQLEERSMRMSELGELMGLTLSGTSRVVQDLESKHLIARSPDEHDRRATVLTLSDEGRRTAELLFWYRESTLDGVFAGWPEEDVAQLSRLLERLETDLRAGRNRIGTETPGPTRESTSSGGGP
jgi:DNA-binding MarR family transcriptional regulator